MRAAQLLDDALARIDGASKPIAAGRLSAKSLLDEALARVPDPEPIAAPVPEVGMLGDLRSRLGIGGNRLTQAGAMLAGQAGILSPDTVVRSVAEDEADIAGYPVSPDIQQGLQKISAAPDFMSALSEIVRNPKSVLAVTAESLPQSIAPLALGAGGALAGSAIGPGGTVAGAMAGGGLGSFAIEYANSMVDALREKGYDPADPEKFKAGLSDPETMAHAKLKGVSRGIPVAVFDGLSMGIAGRIFGPVAKAAGGKALGKVAGGGAELAFQAGTGGAGEAVAQIADEGKVNRWGDVALEMAAETPMAIVEPMLNRPKIAPAEPAPFIPLDQPDAVQPQPVAIPPQPAQPVAPPAPAALPPPMVANRAPGEGLPGEGFVMQPPPAMEPAQPEQAVAQPSAPSAPAQPQPAAAEAPAAPPPFDPQADVERIAPQIAALEPGTPLVMRTMAAFVGAPDSQRIKALYPLLAERGLARQEGRRWLSARPEPIAQPTPEAARLEDLGQQGPIPTGVSQVGAQPVEQPEIIGSGVRSVLAEIQSRPVRRSVEKMLNAMARTRGVNLDDLDIVDANQYFARQGVDPGKTMRAGYLPAEVRKTAGNIRRAAILVSRNKLDERTALDLSHEVGHHAFRTMGLTPEAFGQVWARANPAHPIRRRVERLYKDSDQATKGEEFLVELMAQQVGGRYIRRIALDAEGKVVTKGKGPGGKPVYSEGQIASLIRRAWQTVKDLYEQVVGRDTIRAFLANVRRQAGVRLDEGAAPAGESPAPETEPAPALPEGQRGVPGEGAGRQEVVPRQAPRAQAAAPEPPKDSTADLADAIRELSATMKAMKAAELAKEARETKDQARREAARQEIARRTGAGSAEQPSIPRQFTERKIADATGQPDKGPVKATAERMPVPTPASGKTNTIVGVIDLNDFERLGYGPEEVTRANWVALQRAERRRLGQQEGGDYKAAPWAEYEEFHRDSVVAALKRGDDVDPRVLQDYPDLQTPSEPPAPEVQPPAVSAAPLPEAPPVAPLNDMPNAAIAELIKAAENVEDVVATVDEIENEADAASQETEGDEQTEPGEPDQRPVASQAEGSGGEAPAGEPGPEPARRPEAETGEPPVRPRSGGSETGDRVEAQGEVAPADKPPEKPASDIIQDAGEKIGGARKDLWRERGLIADDLSAMSAGEQAQNVTKENVWPRPDYAALVADGATPDAAYLVKIIYDRIAKRPRHDTEEGRRDYIEMMGYVRAAIDGAKSIDDIKAVRAKVSDKLGLRTGSTPRPDGRRINSSVYANYKDPISIGWSEQQKARLAVEQGWPNQESWQRAYRVRQDFQDKTWFVTGASSSDRTIKAEGFATKEEAETKARELHERRKADRTGADGMPKRPHLDRIEREGRDVRAGRNIGSGDFVTDFGFRGVEFGNWVAGDERQKATNLGYEALHDLADALGVPPKALSLNGALGLAFGARGGGFGLAHYEPGKVVINLTKLSGAGSLAHEWGHALDHYFGELGTDKPYGGMPKSVSGWESKPTYNERRLANLRPEMRDAWHGVMRALFERNVTKAEAVRDLELKVERIDGRIAGAEKLIADPSQRGVRAQNQKFLDWAKDRREALGRQLAKAREEGYEPKATVDSSYYQSAVKIGGKSGARSYWARPTELLARAFESFVFDRIAERGGKSQYLVQGVEASRFGEHSKGNPYPAGEDRARINAAFGKLFDTMQTRESDKGLPVLFRREDQTDTPEFKRWFGDSKVVDEDGRPLRVYHGRADDFEAFRVGPKSRFGHGQQMPGMYFSPFPGTAAAYARSAANAAGQWVGMDYYGENIVPAYLSLRNPKVYRNREDFTSADRASLEAAGHDGAMRYADDTGDLVEIVAFRPEQIKSATGNRGTFDPDDPRINYRREDEAWAAESGVSVEAMNNARGPLYRRVAVAGGHDAEHAIIDRIMGDQPLTMGEKIRAGVQWFKQRGITRVKQGVFDKFEVLAAQEKSTFGDLLDASVSAYKAARLTQNLGSVMKSVLAVGPLEYRDGGFRLREGFSGGFEGIFNDIAERGLLKLWKGWAAAVRADRLYAEGKENLMTRSEIDALLALENEYPEFRDVFDRWQSFNKAMLDMAESAGVIDPEARRIWERDDYVPFYRLMPDPVTGKLERGGPMNRRGIANQSSGIRTLTGGEEKLGDVIENMVMNITHLVDASFKNVAAQRGIELFRETGVVRRIGLDWKPVRLSLSQLADTLQDAGIQVEGLTIEQREEYAKLFSPVPPQADNAISVLVNGKRQYWAVEDPMVLNAFTSLNQPQLDGVMKIFKLSSDVLRKGITSFPGFMIANAMRDTLSAWVQTGKTTPLIGTAKGAVKSLRNDTSAMAIMASGGGLGGWYDTAPEDVRKQLDRKLRNDKPSTMAVNAIRAAWKGWQKVGAASEAANRIDLYDKLRREGVSQAEAAYQAMDLMDFAMRGDYAAVRTITTMVPFLNARLQGLYVLGRKAAANPGGVALRGMVLTAATLALLAANDGEDWYEKLEEWDRDANWHYKTGGVHIRISKPFEIGAIYGAVAERIVRAIKGDDRGKATKEAALRLFMDTLAFNPTPQLVKPVIEQVANLNMFTGRPVVPAALEGVAPEAQIKPGTSEGAIALSRILPGWLGPAKSPARLDALARGYLGTLGETILAGASTLARPFTKPDVERPDRKLSEYPVIGRFLKDEPAHSTRWVTEFYDLKSELDQLARTMSYYRTHGEGEAFERLAKQEAQKIGLHRRADDIGKRISNINAEMRRVEDRPGMSGSDKRRELDRLAEMRTVIAERAVKGMWAELDRRMLTAGN